MTHNPYSPPGTAVTDIDSSVPIERPRGVKVAVILCWISLAIAVPLLFEAFDEETQAGLSTTYLVGVGLFVLALFAFAIWVNISIGRARNWARIVYAVLTGVSLIMAVASPSETLAGDGFSVVAELLSTAMDVVIVVLLFTPAANAWYRVRGRRAADSAA